MRILLASNYYPEHVGGIETVAAGLASGYRERGHEVRWIAGDIGSRPHARRRDDVPVRVWNGIERLGFPYPLPSPGAAIGLDRHVAWAEVVHLHDSLYALNVAAFIATRRRRRPVLLTQHVAKVPYPNPLFRGVQSAAYATIGRSVLSRAEQVVFVSERVQGWFESRITFKRPTHVIENGIDTDLFQPHADDRRGSRPLLLFVGRFVEKKGVRLLRPLIEATPSCDWLFIGRAGDVNPSTWRLPNLRLLAPMQPAQLRDYYAGADLLVLPSSGEGFPVVAQEAMACGTPVLLSESTAAGLPAIHDVVFTSTLARDDLEDALQRSLQTVTRDPGLRRRVASCARDRWRADTMVARYEEQLEGLVR